MNKLKAKAKRLGADYFGESWKKNKRFVVLYKNKYVHFGSKTGKTFFDHKDKKKRKAWYARHSKIKNKSGRRVINLKSSPSFWSARILW